LAVSIEITYYLVLNVSGRLQARLKPTPAQYQGREWVYALRWEEVATNRYDYQPYVVWRRPPYAGKNIFIGEGGIQRTTQANCGNGSLRIFMFGGSALWGSGSPDWGTIPSQLAKVLADSGYSACVKNYGESAWVGTQEVVQLVMALKKGEVPDLVIFYDGWNEISSRYQTGLPDAHANLYDIKQKFEQSPAHLIMQSTSTSKLYDRIMTSLKMQKPYLERYRLRDEPLEGVPASIREQYFRNMWILLKLYYGTINSTMLFSGSP